MMILLDDRLIESIQKYNDTDWDAERERVKHDRGLTQSVGIRAVNAVAFIGETVCKIVKHEIEWRAANDAAVRKSKREAVAAVLQHRLGVGDDVSIGQKELETLLDDVIHACPVITQRLHR